MDLTYYIQHSAYTVKLHNNVLARWHITRFKYWLWLLGKDDILDLYTNYLYYGKYGANALVWVADQLKLDIKYPESDQFTNMVNGEACKEECEKCANWIFDS